MRYIPQKLRKNQLRMQNVAQQTKFLRSHSHVPSSSARFLDYVSLPYLVRRRLLQKSATRFGVNVVLKLSDATPSGNGPVLGELTGTAASVTTLIEPFMLSSARSRPALHHLPMLRTLVKRLKPVRRAAEHRLVTK